MPLRLYEQELSVLLCQKQDLLNNLARIKKDVSTETEKLLKRTTKLQLWIKEHKSRVLAKPTRSGGKVEALKIQVLESISILENTVMVEKRRLVGEESEIFQEMLGTQERLLDKLLEVLEEAGAEVAVDALQSKYQGDRSWILAMTLDQNEQFNHLVEILKEKKVQDLPALDDLQSILRTINAQEQLLAEALNSMNDLKTNKCQVLEKIEIIDRKTIALHMVLRKSGALHQLSVVFSVVLVPSLFFYLMLMFVLTG